MAGTLFVVATPIGNLEDISARALRILRQSALIAAEDTRRTARLLAHYGITTPTTSYHQHSEKQKAAGLIARLVGGDDVALVSDAGTPTVSDPGHVLVRAAIDAGVRVESIPGPSAILAVLAASGLPMESFSFHGFPPTRSEARKRWFERLRAVGGTVVFFESPHRITSTLAQLQAEVGDRPVVVGRELTKAFEELVRGPISGVSEKLVSPKGELTVALNIGQTTDNGGAGPPEAHAILSEFGGLTKFRGLTRRQAITRIARKYGMPAGAVYGLIEAAKKSGE